MPKLTYDKYRRSFGNIGQLLLTPLGYATCYDKLIGRCNIARHRQFRLRSTHLKHLLHKFHIAVWSLDKNLRLMLNVRPTLQSLNSLATLGWLYGQITVKSE